MNNILTKLFMVIMLMMFSMGAMADVKVLFGEKGTELQPAKDGTITLGQKELTGGTIIISQEDQKDGTTKVIFAVTPDKNYKLAEDGLEVYAVVPTSIGRTRGIEVSTKLTLKSNDYKDDSSKRTYATTIDSNLALWVKSADFQKKRDDSKGSGSGTVAPKGNDYSGTYYISNSNNNTSFWSSTIRTDRYYLCPSTDCIDTNNEKPFLTTHKIDGLDNKKWEVEFVETNNGIDYYHLIYVSSTRMYLTYNTAPNSSYENRGRVHLQTTLDGNNSLFYFTRGTYGDKLGVNIIPKADSSNMSINPARANTDSYNGINNGGGSWNKSGTTIQFGGLIGLYTANNGTGVWYLEDIVETPTISINSDGKAVISSSNASATYYYTDGTTKPTTGSGSTKYTSPIDITDIETIKAIAEVNGEVSNVATYTVGNGTPYIIQNQECTAYYLISGDATQANVPANTSSIYGPKMEWALKYAGNVNGIQYYYFVNNRTKNYLYRTGDNIYVKAFADNDDGYKFNFFTQNTDGSYNIYAKNVINKSLYKTNGNIEVDNVKLNATLTDAHARWMFISTSNVADKRSLFEASPVAASNYYKIASYGTSGSYIISPVESGGIEYAGVSNVTNDNMVWMFEEAAHDEWQTFYNIVSATTGKYMYYVGPGASSTATQANAIEMKDNLTDKERYQFVLARATYDDYYYIIPKTHKDVFTGNKYYGIWLDTSILKTILHRASGGINVKWKFENAPSTFIAPPSITFSADDMKVIMQSTTDNIGDMKYDYTIGTADAPSDATTAYPEGGIDVKYGPIYHFAAKTEKDGNTSILVTKDIDLSYIAVPTISVSGNTVTFSTTQKGMTFYYTTDGSEPKYIKDEDSNNNGVAIDSNSEGTANVTLGNDLYNIIVIAVSIMDDTDKTGYSSSPSDMKIVDLREATTINTLADIISQTGFYKCSSTFSATGTPKIDGTGDEIGTSSKPFKGTLEGYWDETKKEFKSINLSKPLFDYVEDATIKNIIVAEGTISGTQNGSGNVGAIAGNALGRTRIYNCGVLGGSVEGSNNVGGIVGMLDGRSRVINCFNYANITSGSNCGGIVGYNNVASTSSNLQTMVMNCMFYGNIEGGNAAPIYGGEIIHNKYDSKDDTGLNNYCYFLYDEEKSPYVKTIANDNYHGALGAEERYLNRFEFFRMMLNSTRNLAAYYVTGYATQKEEMAKWVLDRSIAPYPILKIQDNYPSVVNPDVAHATTQTERNKGGLLGTLSVTISGPGSGAVFSAPTGASIKTGSKTLNITDKDYDNFNFNYKKVQLPYFNEVGIGNYTKASDGTGRVVTGWKITSITGGTPGSFTTDSYDYPDFNFVDRKCTNKDLYSVSKRVFAQGAYWEVPDGVTAITIEPYWAKAVYLSDANYDMTYTITLSGSGSSSTATANKYGVTVCGSCPTVCNGQTVYTDLSTAMTNLASDANHTVYDYAVVLVGNYHQAHNNALVNNDKKPVTFMSADLDGDNEPDNTLFYYHNQRKVVSPVRFDFLNIPGIGMVKRTYNSSMDPEPGILAPQGWFEITNTVFIRFGQFEYAGSNSATKTILAPLILQGGIYEQFVSCTRTNAKNTNYLLIGGNAWFKNFANGCHTNTANTTPKVPINVTGGDYTNFYLTGIYQPAAAEASENAECYIDGGRFTEVAGAGMQQVKGDVTWLINAADITSFYGGGINAAKPITGSICTTISNSYVDEFYGGPKFGDMAEETTVTTNATDCHFGKFFGAGYGGTAFNKVLPSTAYDSSSEENTRTWNKWVTDQYKRAYNAGNGGISTNYEYEFILHSDGNQTVARFYVDYASLSLASTRNVTSTLSGCTIGTFYGGGSLGAVNGDVNSTLTDCTVTGNVFGAGFSASVPTVEVWNTGAYLTPDPTYNRTANVFNNASVKTPKDNNQFIVYTWSKDHGTNADPFTDTEDGKHYIHTEVSLDGLGAVSGDVTLKIKGTTTVAKSVYGGGEESDVKGNTNVTMEGGYVFNGIFGGGLAGSVGTFTRSTAAADVTVYGHTAHDGCIGKPKSCTEGTGKCTVKVTGGQIGPIEVATKGMTRPASEGGPVPEGWVWGGGCGIIEDPETHPDTHFKTYVGSTDVTIGGTAFILESIIGGGEFGRVLGDTHVTIEGNCQIGVGAGQVDGDNPRRYADEKFIDPTTTPITNDNALAECSHYEYGHDYDGDGKPEYLTFDPYYDKYYGEMAEDNIPDGLKLGSTSHACDGKTWIGCVFGGGSGYFPYEKDDGTGYGWVRSAGWVEGNTLVEIKGGHILTNVYGANEYTDVKGKSKVIMSGGTIGVPRTLEQIKANPLNGNLFGAGKGDPRTYFNEITTVGSTEVEVTGGIIYGNVYGGGEDGHVTGNAVTTIGKETTTNEVTTKTGPVIGCVDTSDSNGNVFGGGMGSVSTLTAGVVGGNATLGILGGRVLGSVYGGGQIASVGTYLANVGHANYGKMQEGSDHGCLTVNLTGGTIDQNVYGGCMGANADASRGVNEELAVKFGISKTVELNLNQGVANNARGCAVKKDIFGCNNVNSSPQQAVSVHIYATQNADKTQIANTPGDTPAVTDAKRKDVYDVHAVYGGGNLAAYKPIGPNPTADDDDGKNTTYSTNVIIDGCGLTSIQYVYGGGNAASTPATNLTVNGTYEIEEVFGGGNGKDDIIIDGKTKPNPGANVGYYNYSQYVEKDGTTVVEDNPAYDTKEKRQNSAIQYGTGKASVNIFGGTVHRVFGGSNTKGNVRQTAVTMLEEVGGCDFCVDEAYGGGKSAPMDAEAKLLMACIPGLKAAYGGAEAADIQGNVTLTITNGTFDRVFGGNNLSGTISGSITVNVEEVGCRPIIIGELYGGGNQAAYSVYGYKAVGTSYKIREDSSDGEAVSTPDTPYSSTQFFADPQVNVKSFTSIGNIYGGGFGADAVMVGSPTVNIDEVVGTPETYPNTGDFDSDGYKGKDITIDGHSVTLPSHTKNKIGAINKVYGGGNAAQVKGNTNVNIGTQGDIFVVVNDKNITVGTTDVTNYYIRSGSGTEDDPYNFDTKATGTAQEGITYYERKAVVGVDIRGDVYGGGNEAEVTGNTNVIIGKEAVATPTPEP